MIRGFLHQALVMKATRRLVAKLVVVIDADSPEEAMIKLRDAGLEPVKAEPFDAHPRGSKGAAPAR